MCAEVGSVRISKKEPDRPSNKPLSPGKRLCLSSARYIAAPRAFACKAKRALPPAHLDEPQRPCARYMVVGGRFAWPEASAPCQRVRPLWHARPRSWPTSGKLLNPGASATARHERALSPAKAAISAKMPHATPWETPRSQEHEPSHPHSMGARAGQTALQDRCAQAASKTPAQPKSTLGRARIQAGSTKNGIPSITP